jgi:hypothetical protein
MNYYKPTSGEWTQPVRRSYRFACCDCGLVHAMNFRLVANDHGAGRKIQFQAERDNRATGQTRRWMKKLIRTKR